MFSQLLYVLNRNDFNNPARKYGGDIFVKQFTCNNQLCVLMFGQLSNRESLSDVIPTTQAHASKECHLGFGKHAAKSTFTDANTKCDYHIFDSGYNDFKHLHNIESIGAYFVIRGRTNNDFKPMKLKRRFPTESGIQSYAVGYMAGQLTMEKYPDKIRRVIY